MEQHEQNQQEAYLPHEVVEIYRQPGPREIVLTYTRSLPDAWTETTPAMPPVRRRGRRGLWIFLACFAVVVLLTAVSSLWQGIGWIEKTPSDEKMTDPFAEVLIPTAPIGQGMVLSVLQEHGEALPPQEIYRQANPSVVTIVTRLEGDQGALGTGVIFSEDGYILTNYHVLAGGTECMVVLHTGERYEAKYVAGDTQIDLAVLKVDATDLPAAEFGDSDLLTVGDPAYAIGNPLNYELLGTMTDGIISAVDRQMSVDGRVMTLLQTNAALNNGNSGGPLINQYGQVVGINVIKMSSADNAVEGLGFAIPSSTLDRAVNDLLTYGELQPEPVLGVTVISVAEEVEEGVWGLLVEFVTDGGAADLAGVQKGDVVLTADGEQMLSSQDLLRVRRHHYVGDELPMTLWRDGEIVEVVLALKDAVEDIPD